MLGAFPRRDVATPHAGHDRIGMTRTRYFSSRSRARGTFSRLSRSDRTSAEAPAVIAGHASEPLLLAVRIHVRLRLDLRSVAARTDALDDFGIRGALWIRGGLSHRERNVLRVAGDLSRALRRLPQASLGFPDFVPSLLGTRAQFNGFLDQCSGLVVVHRLFPDPRFWRPWSLPERQ